jgi:para-nitrobenzyl esterase
MMKSLLTIPRSVPAVALALALSAFAAAAQNEGPVVAVTGGRVQGRLLAAPGGAVFKGIPFAQPPVGELRWREPAAVKPWTGVKDAGAYGAPCAQIAAGWNDKVAAMGNEDCLYLNVWSPQWPARSRHAVMFWIHGGANMGGSALGGAGIEPLFDGQELARRGVVVVTVNYRLGMFGFIAHPELSAESAHHASGNYGLLDLVAALHWVQENIAKFGGDPGNVTIFGQSAGAQDTGLLMSSPLAAGLFQRAIQQSGSVIIRGMGTPTLAEVEQNGVKLADKMNAPPTGAIRFLRALSTADVLKGSPPYGGGGMRGGPRTGPNVDGYFLTRAPGERLRSGQEARVPLIVGSNGREMVTFPAEPEALRKAIEAFYGPLAPAALKVYGIEGGSVETYAPYGTIAAQVSTDTMFRCSAVVTAEWHSARNPTWQYEFTRGVEPEGARHSLELRYVFGLTEEQKLAPIDSQLSDLMQRYWANFARSGDPNGAGVPRWPAFKTPDAEYLEFSEQGPLVKARLREAACAVFREKVSPKTN